MDAYRDGVDLQILGNFLSGFSPVKILLEDGPAAFGKGLDDGPDTGLHLLGGQHFQRVGIGETLLFGEQ